MAKAGFCASCGRNVWLTDDGGCENGHAPSQVSGVYDPAAPEPLLVPPASTFPVRRVAIAVVIGVIVLIAAVSAVLAVALPPLISKGAAASSDWLDRLDTDYPGWRPVSFNNVSGDDESRWTFGLVPPGRRFVVGVTYAGHDGMTPIARDEILRPAGRHHELADSLLDFLESRYAKQRKSITSVTSDDSGAVTVTWLKVTQVGPISTRFGSFDELSYDQGSHTWSASPGTGTQPSRSPESSPATSVGAVAPTLPAGPATPTVATVLDLPLDEFGSPRAAWRKAMGSATVRDDHIVVLVTAELSSADIDRMATAAKAVAAKRHLKVTQLDVMYESTNSMAGYRLL